MCRHGHIRVQVNTEVPNRADGHDIVGADAEWYGRNLILASTGRTPQHFGLLGIQLQANIVCIKLVAQVKKNFKKKTEIQTFYLRF